jgi:hypothetical protein
MKEIRILSRISSLALVALVSNSVFAQGQITYTKDIAPILNTHCVTCHRAGEIAPMSLRTYEEVRPWAKSIRNQITNKKMPPWFASEASVKFRNENTLEQEQIDLINKWISQGAKQGNPKDMPAPRKFDDSGWDIGEPDLVVTMDKPFRIPDDEDDIQPDIHVPGTVQSNKWIKAIEVKPGNRAIVHHTLVYLLPKEGSPKRGPFGQGDLVGLYGPGVSPTEFPEAHGQRFDAGSTISLNMHYHKEKGVGTAAEDQTSVGMIFADGPIPNPVTTAWIAQPELNIPAYAENVESMASFTFLDDGHILSLAPHLHYRGKDFKYTAEYPDGTQKVLLDVPEFDFNWQFGYLLPEPMAIPKGTVIRAVAHHDNSIGNPYNPDPSKKIKWGSETTDEMMIGFMDYTYASLKDSQSELPDAGGAPAQRTNRNARGGNATSRNLNNNVGAARILRGFDNNKDGVIQRSEIPDAFNDFFEIFDRDQDGKVTREELQ